MLEARRSVTAPEAQSADRSNLAGTICEMMKNRRRNGNSTSINRTPDLSETTRRQSLKNPDRHPSIVVECAERRGTWRNTDKGCKAAARAAGNGTRQVLACLVNGQFGTFKLGPFRFSCLKNTGGFKIEKAIRWLTSTVPNPWTNPGCTTEGT
jgi:hypothetical protein